MRDMEEKYRISYTPKANDELADIQRYITVKFKDPETALNQAIRITKAARALAVFPKLYRVRKKDAQGREVRYCPIDNYVILYYIDEAEHTVIILHIIYSKRNIDAII